MYQVKYFRIHFLETFGLSLVGYHLITISGCCNEISNALATTSNISVAIKVLSRQTTSFVATKVYLSRQNITCLSRQKYLSRQKFCRGKHTFVGTKDVVCRDKHVLVATKRLSLQKNDTCGNSCQ